jgi:sodium-independent sulfate anion transporter 11
MLIPQFHFATVLSPWIRRALIAGGFGIDSSTISIPQEIAPVVSYRGGNRDDFTSDRHNQPDDAEAQGDKHGVPPGSSSTGDFSDTGNLPLCSVDTPFIHFDLASAVSAAESSLRRDSFGQDVKQ